MVKKVKMAQIVLLLLGWGAGVARGAYYVSMRGSDTPPYDTPERAARSIQVAVALSEDGSTIFVDEGTYEGAVVLMGNRELRGQGAEQTVMRCPTSSYGMAALTIQDSAWIDGFTVDGTGCQSAVECAGGVPVITNCIITGGGSYGVYARGSSPWLESCTIRGNGRHGFWCLRGSPVIYDCVISGNRTGVTGLERTLTTIRHSTIVGNLYTGVDGVEGEYLVWDTIVWGNGEDLYYVSPWEVINSNVGDPDLSGHNANVSLDPLFVGWGGFNDTDNPILVDALHTGDEDGTKANPFRTISAALNVYDYHLAVESPCFAAASDGRNIGAFPDAVPDTLPGPASVLVSVRPGVYSEGRLPILGGAFLAGAGSRLTVLKPPKYHVAAWFFGTSSIEGFAIIVDQASSALLRAPGSSPSVANCVISSRPPWGQADLGISGNFTRIVSCLIHGMRNAVSGSANVSGCTITDNLEGAFVFNPHAPPVISNSIVWANGTDEPVLAPASVTYSLVSDATLAGINGNIFADPQFLNPNAGDFRLRPDSPCIDAGFNDPDLPEADIAGMHRIMFGGKSLTVDMGAYEFYINALSPDPQPQDTTLTWSSLADRTYSIFYTDDLFNWQTAIDNFPSLGNQTTSWTDDGSLTGVPPSLVPRRFYRILENP